MNEYSLIRIVLRRTDRGAVDPCPNLLELTDGRTSSRVITDYRGLTTLNCDPWVPLILGSYDPWLGTTLKMIATMSHSAESDASSMVRKSPKTRHGVSCFCAYAFLPLVGDAVKAVGRRTVRRVAHDSEGVGPSRQSIEATR
jgi:hypothetical protein